jgi:hypothetical protein
MNRQQFAAAHNRYLDPPEDEEYGADDGLEPCEWCNSYKKCKCEQEIDDYDWQQNGG